LSENIMIKINENYNGIITDQCKQRVALGHVGLVKDHGGYQVNQSRLSLFEKC